MRARVAARIVAGQTSNVIGRLGDGPDRDRILLTTALSGWFRCAGERGTGSTSADTYGQQLWNYYQRSYPANVRAHYPDLAE